MMLNRQTLVLGAAIAVAAFMVISNSWYTIDEGERGVLLRTGAVSGTAEPGLGFKIPFVDKVKRISVQSGARIYEQVPAYSKDQQPAEIKMSVNYRIPADEVGTVYASYGGEDGMISRLLDRRVYEDLKTVFGRFNAVTAIQERARLNQEVAEAIQGSVRGPIIIESVQIENIDFSDAYEASIEQRMLAEVEVQKLRQNAEREKVQAEITVTRAKANADAVRAQAEADAAAIRIRGQAEADAIKARGDALRENPSLVELTKAEKWDGKLPSTMVPGGATPMINLGK